MRIKGWMGRADQTAKVKGMFVHPSQVNQISARHVEVTRVRLTIEHDQQQNDVMTLHCECVNNDEALATAIADSIREVTKLRGSVKFVATDSLPNDGKVIDDLRKFD
jgi:phenylacetate-CoA ligase